jgi:hypothetical protein
MKIISVIVCALILVGCASMPDVNTDYIWSKNIVYGNGYLNDGNNTKELLLDVVEKRGEDKLKIPIVIIHGGSFTGGSRKDSDLVSLAEELCDFGYKCFLVDYRLEKDNPPIPVEFQNLTLGRTSYPATVDIKKAVKYIKWKHLEYNIDPNKLVLVGESAGAFITYSIGFADDTYFVQDSINPPLNVEYAGLSGKPEYIVGLWGSCQLYLDKIDSSDPPVMIAHGTNDMTPGATFLDSLTISIRCDNANLRHVFYAFVGDEHGAWKGSSGGKDIAELIVNFIR